MRLPLAIFAAIASPALAQVAYTSQVRSVHAWATGLAFAGPNVTLTAPDFASFVQTATSVSSDSSGSAYQSSSLEPGGIFAQFSAQASEHNGYWVQSSSTLDVTFGIGQASTWTLAGSFNQLSSVLLTTQAGGTIFSAPMGSAGSLNAGGVLESGFYRLQVNCRPEPGSFSPSNVSLNLTVPAPGAAGLLPLLALAAGRSRRA